MLSVFIVTITTSLWRGRAGCLLSIGNTVPNEAGVRYLGDESNSPNNNVIPWFFPDMCDSLPLFEAHLRGEHFYWLLALRKRLIQQPSLKIESVFSIIKIILLSWKNFKSFSFKIIQSSLLLRTGEKKKTSRRNQPCCLLSINNTVTKVVGASVSKVCGTQTRSYWNSPHLVCEWKNMWKIT